MLPWTLAFFWLIAFISATHDIAADGYYMLALETNRQALFVGVRTLFYRLLHQEPVRTSADPFIEGVPDPQRDPYDSNQAIPTLLATRDRERFHRLFPNLKISGVDWFSLTVYPLSGGFKSWSLVPEMLASPMLRVERAVEPFLGRFAAFRMMLVIEKTNAG